MPDFPSTFLALQAPVDREPPAGPSTHLHTVSSCEQVCGLSRDSYTIYDLQAQYTREHSRWCTYSTHPHMLPDSCSNTCARSNQLVKVSMLCLYPSHDPATALSFPRS